MEVARKSVWGFQRTSKMNGAVNSAIIFVYMSGCVLAEEAKSSFNSELFEKIARETEGGVKALPFEKGESNIRCFSGFLLRAGDNVGFEVFPQLGLLRVRVSNGSSDEDYRWVILNNLKDLDVAKSEKIGGWVLSKTTQQLILGVGSGLLRQDLMSSSVICEESSGYKIKKMKVESSDFSEYAIVRVLICPSEFVEDQMYEKGGFWVQFEDTEIQVPRQIEGTPESSKESER